MTKTLRLQVLLERYAVSRLEPGSPLPAWADGPGFVTISRTGDELSIVCREDRVPTDIVSVRGWIALQFLGPFAFDETGIVLAVVRPLSEARIGVFVVSTFDCDHLLLKASDFPAAELALTKAGHAVLPPGSHPTLAA